jgi:hypothetical protein
MMTVHTSFSLSSHVGDAPLTEDTLSNLARFATYETGNTRQRNNPHQDRPPDTQTDTRTLKHTHAHTHAHTHTHTHTVNTHVPLFLLLVLSPAPHSNASVATVNLPRPLLSSSFFVLISRAGIRLRQLFGLTECSGFTSLAAQHQPASSIGTTLPGTLLRLASGTDTICCHGRNVMSGYAVTGEDSPAGDVGSDEKEEPEAEGNIRRRKGRQTGQTGGAVYDAQRLLGARDGCATHLRGVRDGGSTQRTSDGRRGACFSSGRCQRKGKTSK